MSVRFSVAALARLTVLAAALTSAQARDEKKNQAPPDLTWFNARKN
jgi:hypothetical protein